MSCGCQSTGAQLCGCCTGVTQETPQVVVNRASLPAISYRVGTYPTFLASMEAALPSSSYPALAGLRTRDSGDFSIALIDAWAEVLDILTFYTERLANEAYLGTAVEGRSVFELAKLVGYSPSPGVSASAVLAFTLSSAPGSPDNVPIPAGTRVQSVPGPGQTAQVFETSGDIVAQIGWNAIPAQTTTSWSLAAGATSTWISGTANNINVGDALLFVAAQGGVPTNTGPTDFHYVTAVSPNSATGNTQVTWDGPLSSSSFSNEDASTMCIYTFDKKAALYGVQAPNLMTLAGTTLAGTTLQYVKGYVGPPYGNGSTWDYASLYQDGSYTINLDASYPGLEPSQAPGAQPQWLVLTGTGEGYTSVFQITNAVDTNPNYFTLTAKTTQVTLQKVQILAGASWL